MADGVVVVVGEAAVVVELMEDSRRAGERPAYGTSVGKRRETRR